MQEGGIMTIPNAKLIETKGNVSPMLKFRHCC
jgi:hypothetical protein